MMSSKTVLITGITGMDAAHLAKFLLTRGDRVVGTRRPNASGSLWRLEKLGISRDIEIIPMDLTDPHSVLKAVDYCLPNQVYNLAAQSHVGLSYECPVSTVQVNGVGVVNLLEALRGSQAKVYQAGTSEMFGHSPMPVTGYHEKVPFRPVSPYAAGKVMASYALDTYREAYGVDCREGILFNHESTLRGPNFVTQKIVQSLSRWYKTGDSFELGNVSAVRDWGWAPEYVEGMVNILEEGTESRYVLATGMTLTVFQFLEEAAKAIGVSVIYDKDRGRIADMKSGATIALVTAREMRPTDVPFLKGDPSQALMDLGWTPMTKGPEVARLMMEAALEA
jgi:GDPmannose 4,6-dehydratase